MAANAIELDIFINESNHDMHRDLVQMTTLLENGVLNSDLQTGIPDKVWEYI